jgi:hypothetical protein
LRDDHQDDPWTAELAMVVIRRLSPAERLRLFREVEQERDWSLGYVTVPADVLRFALDVCCQMFSMLTKQGNLAWRYRRKPPLLIAGGRRHAGTPICTLQDV